MLNTDFKAAIDQLQANPIACGALAIRAFEELNNGTVKVIDPSGPFPFLMETAVVLYANSLDRCGAILNRLYKSNANSYQDLYRHMSSLDYSNRFSSPGQAPIMFFLEIDELMKKAVDTGGGTGNRKLTISRNSQIIASDTKLTFLYPVDIIITTFNTITVKYDVSNQNPLLAIADTVIPSEIRKSDRTYYLYFELPVPQIEINSVTFSVTGSQGLKRQLKFSDKFYFIRAFMRDDVDTAWTELTVKHNPMVIDNNSVTVIANVDTINNNVSVQLPQVYKNTGLLKENIRIDIYTTQGDINVPLFNINDSLFKASWQDHETTLPNKFAAPMSTFSDYKIASDGTIDGGADGLTFDELRNKVVNRSIVTEGLSITENQLSTTLENKGFTTIIALDNVTDRDLLATRPLTDPSLFNLNTTAIGSLTITAANTFDKMVENQQSVRDNDGQLTVLPNAVYELVDGKLENLQDTEVTSLLLQRGTNVDTLANNLNARKIYYSPYFMTHTYRNGYYQVKPYRLDKPKILTKSIEQENLLLGYTSSISAYSIQLDADYSGYSIYVQITPSDSLKQVPVEDLNMQMRIADENNRYYYWFTGALVTPIDPSTGRPLNDYYVYRFALPTNWGITDNEELLIGTYKIPFKLDGYADIYTVVKKAGLNASYKSDMDRLINPKLFPGWTVTTSANYYGLIQEKVRIVLGQHMQYLWRQQRSAVDQTAYQTYPEDVIATWEEDVIAKDTYGNDAFTLGPGNVLNFTYEHRKGDVKVDELNNPIVLHAAGDYVVDDNGNPVPINGERGIMRNYDIVLLDAKYYFANHAKTVEYRESVKDEIDSWMDIMSSQAGELIGRTTLYAHPKITEGAVRALLDNGVESYINSAQSLRVEYMVNERISANADAVTEIKTKTISVLQSILSSSLTVSNSDLVAGLKDQLGDWIIGVKITGFLGDQFKTVSVLDSSIQLSIPKRLTVSSNLELVVENDISITFVTHSTLVA